MNNKKELTKIDKIVIKYYDKESPSELCNRIGYSTNQFRGITARLSKLGEIVTPNKKKKLELAQLEADRLAKKEGNSFTNTDGINKQIARNLVVGEIKDSGLVGKVLGLPFETCTFELQLLKQVSKHFTFIGCEHKPQTFYKMLQTVIDNKINMECSPNPLLETVKNTKRDNLAHVFADFCGQFDTYAEDIKLILKKKLVQVGGIVAISISNRKVVKNSIINNMNSLEPIGVREGNKVENGIRTFLTKQAKENYATTKVFSYKDDEKQAMLLFILKRVK